MIAKGSTTIVNFYVADTDGLPATGQASNISASISLDGGTATTINATISEKDSTNLPGWYEFEYTFSTAGNAFITFSCTGCIIMPWEEQVVELSTSSAPSASDIADAVWTKDIDSYSYSTTPGMAYKYLKGVDLLLTNVSFAVSDIPADVWNYSSGRTITNTIPSASTIANEVWSKTVTNYNTTGQAGYLLRSTGALVWEYAGSRLVTNTIPTTEQIASSVWGAQYRELTSDLATSSALSAVASNVAAVKAKTDNLPASPAATGDAMTLTSAYDAAKTASQLTSADLSGLSTFDPTTDTVLIDATQAAGMATASGFATSTALSAVALEVSAVKAKTDNLPASPAATGDIPSVADIQSGLAKTSDLASLSTFDPSSDTVLIDSTQAATMQTAIGFATPNDIPSDYAKPGDAMTLTNAYDAAKTASQLTTSDIPTVSDIQSGLAKTSDLSGLSTFDPTTDTVLIDATQAATMTTATGFATSSDIPSVADIQSGLATKTDVSNTQTAIINAMPSTSGLATVQNVTDAKEAIIAEIPAVPNDYAKASDLSGLSTFNAATDKVTLNSTEDATLGAIKTKVDTLNNADLTGIATASDVNGAQSAIIAAMPTIPNDYAKPSDVPTVAQIQSGLAKTTDLSGLSTLTVNDIPTPPSVEQIQNGLATSANISALQAHGDSHWGISPEGEITVVVDADEIAEAVWNNDERTLTDDISTITAQDVWEYGFRSLTEYGPDISPDEPVGAVYCTPSDVERRWGINNVRQWADLENDGDEAKIQTQIDWAILAASERINSDLAASVYLLPFNPVPYAVRRFAATLAGVELFNTRAVNISREQSNGEIRTALADYSNWITSVLSNVPIVGATLK